MSEPDAAAAQPADPAAPGESEAGAHTPARTDTGAESQAAAAPSTGETSYTPPPDPERGLRGVMSAILVFEAIAILLGLTVIANGGTHAPAWEIITVIVLALAHLGVPAVMRRPFAVPLIAVLQALLIACWAIAAALGITGIVFLIVWVLILAMRREFRKRLAAGTMH